MSQDSTNSGAFYQLVDTLTVDICKLRENKLEQDTFSLRPHFQQLLYTFREKCEQQGRDASAIEMMVYAFVAAIDEAALVCGGELASFWMVSTLQFEYYSENTAGQTFFSHLKELQKDPERNSDSIYVFYRMLAIGFEGMYFGDRKTREEVIESCARILIRTHATRIPAVQTFTPPKVSKPSTFYMPGWAYIVIVIVVIIIAWIVNGQSMKASTNDTIKKVSNSFEKVPVTVKDGEE